MENIDKAATTIGVAPQIVAILQDRNIDFKHVLHDAGVASSDLSRDRRFPPLKRQNYLR